MTDLEQKIFDLVKKSNGKLSAHQIGHQLKLNREYGSRTKQVVGMAIGRMVKKGIPIQYNWSGYRIIEESK